MSSPKSRQRKSLKNKINSFSPFFCVITGVRGSFLSLFSGCLHDLVGYAHICLQSGDLIVCFWPYQGDPAIRAETCFQEKQIEIQQDSTPICRVYDGR